MSRLLHFKVDVSFSIEGLAVFRGKEEATQCFGVSEICFFYVHGTGIELLPPLQREEGHESIAQKNCCAGCYTIPHRKRMLNHCVWEMKLILNPDYLYVGDENGTTEDIRNDAFCTDLRFLNLILLRMALLARLCRGRPRNATSMDELTSFSFEAKWATTA
ncbi:hypothetical protein KP509_27G045100 [Ceratopteris richardii]|uniref:Uncharacterized protein n=1 Tax=Ceratopteris richardii TaxID=49495 RepID=A0A8T2RHV4_CERRI|nr:hypothetical protein KP509_27G045100 [Ceratopteris richardii]